MSVLSRAALLLGCSCLICCGNEPPPREPLMPSALPSFSVAVVPPSTSLPVTRSPTTSYSQVYANAERSSRVASRRVVPKALQKLISFEGKTAGADDSFPRFVLPAPSGAFALVDPVGFDFMRVFKSGAGLTRVRSAAPAAFVVSDDGYTDVRGLRPWTDDKDTAHVSGTTLAIAVDGPRTMRLHTSQLHAEANLDGHATATHGSHVYHAELDGELSGALSATRGAVVVETRTSRLSILPPPFALEPGVWKPSVVREVGKPNQGIYEVSILRDGIALVADMMPKRGGWGPARREKDRPDWPSSVIVLDEEANQLYRIDLPWSVAMPVIDLGPGRIAVAGSHLVVYQQGQEVWRLDGGPVWATAFADGSLAVTRRDELLVFDPDGKELARLRAPAPDPPIERRVFRTTPQGSRLGEIVALPNLFTTPPAIAADESIWAATAWELFVAR